jgi:hypothetical protein
LNIVELRINKFLSSSKELILIAGKDKEEEKKREENIT